MGSSVSVNLNTNDLVNLVEEKYKLNPSEVTEIVKECNKKVNRLNKENKLKSFYCQNSVGCI